MIVLMFAGCQTGCMSINICCWSSVPTQSVVISRNATTHAIVGWQQATTCKRLICSRCQVSFAQCIFKVVGPTACITPYHVNNSTIMHTVIYTFLKLILLISLLCGGDCVKSCFLFCFIISHINTRTHTAATRCKQQQQQQQRRFNRADDVIIGGGCGARSRRRSLHN